MESTYARYPLSRRWRPQPLASSLLLVTPRRHTGLIVDILRIRLSRLDVLLGFALPVAITGRRCQKNGGQEFKSRDHHGALTLSATLISKKHGNGVFWEIATPT